MWDTHIIPNNVGDVESTMMRVLKERHINLGPVSLQPTVSVRCGGISSRVFSIHSAVCTPPDNHGVFDSRGEYTGWSTLSFYPTEDMTVPGEYPSIFGEQQLAQLQVELLKVDWRIDPFTVKVSHIHVKAENRAWMNLLGIKRSGGPTSALWCLDYNIPDVSHVTQDPTIMLPSNVASTNFSSASASSAVVPQVHATGEPERAQGGEDGSQVEGTYPACSEVSSIKLEDSSIRPEDSSIKPEDNSIKLEDSSIKLGDYV